MMMYTLCGKYRGLCKNFVRKANVIKNISNYKNNR